MLLDAIDGEVTLSLIVVVTKAMAFARRRTSIYNPPVHKIIHLPCL